MNNMQTRLNVTIQKAKCVGIGIITRYNIYLLEITRALPDGRLIIDRNNISMNIVEDIQNL